MQNTTTVLAFRLVDSMIFQEDEADSTQRRIELLHLRAAAQILRAREDVTEIGIASTSDASSVTVMAILWIPLYRTY